MNKKLSIIIACYNDPSVIIAVKHAYNQTYDNKEIILVDDGSDTETKRVINSVKTFVTRLIVQENKGQSIARNRGIQESSGEYILNWDSDDYFEPTFAEIAISKFEKDKTIKIVTCKARRYNQKGTVDVFTPKGGDIDNFLFANSALGSSMFLRKDWSSCGGYEEKLPILGLEDWEFYIRILLKGGYAFVVPEVLFNYQIRLNSTTSLIKDTRHEKFKHIIIKHKEVYLDNFEGLIDNLFSRLTKAEIEKNRNRDIIDFKLGHFLLTPLRYIKRIFLSKKKLNGKLNDFE